MNVSNGTTETIGAFFTPLIWAKWVVKNNGLFDRWLDGALILDPTAGEGNLLEAFIATAIDNGVEIRNEMLERLIGIEKEERFVANFFSRMKSRYQISFPRENFRIEDFICSANSLKADIVVGNPPWQNFNDLPHLYKEKLKPYFFRYHLVSNAKDLLLGGSRIDMAALVIAKCIAENMNVKGTAYFFMPLSILLNDSAHKAFRSYKLGGDDFAVKEVFDFGHLSIFDGVVARYGLVSFQRDVKQIFPIPYHVFESDGWTRKRAMPAFNPDDPLSIIEDNADSSKPFSAFKKIKIAVESKPRQGVNTCGANDVFIFDTLVKFNGTMARVGNKVNRDVTLPLKYLFPLAAKDNFNEAHPVPLRFVLLPYNSSTGTPLEKSEIQKESALHAYLISQKSILQKRKGTFINSWIMRGYWWALLGVGRYSFARHKILWEAYGRNTFSPRIFSGRDEMCWQGNQALHAYIPCEDRKSAERICASLRNPFVQHYLSSQLMEGTCNWAQPGRVSKLLELTNN
jgi:hypothetical protein